MSKLNFYLSVEGPDGEFAKIPFKMFMTEEIRKDLRSFNGLDIEQELNNVIKQDLCLEIQQTNIVTQLVEKAWNIKTD